MPTFAQNLTVDMAKCSDTNSVRTDITTALTTLRTSLYAEIVTQAGKAATSAEWLGVEEVILELARVAADTCADYTG